MGLDGDLMGVDGDFMGLSEQTRRLSLLDFGPLPPLIKKKRVDKNIFG